MANHEEPRRDEISEQPAVTGTPPAAGEPIDDSYLPPRAWLARNGTYLVIGAALIVFLIAKFGVAFLANSALVALGLGFVIFFHELGHFAVAKWCDVHVETFSIGFGPALPGCSFRRGETLYKIALVPLGGYVKMVGEGPEDGDDDPRSFKNKPVGQRMWIISAGVIMNIILAAICFVVVFTHGKERQPAIVGMVDPGSPLWEKGVPSGAQIVQIGDVKGTPERPLYFQDILSRVLYSAKDEKIHLVYELADGSRHEVDVEPKLDPTLGIPRLGFAAPETTQFPGEKAGKLVGPLAPSGSPAAAAREPFPWHAGDRITQVQGADDKGPVVLPKVKDGDKWSREHYTFELSRQWLRLAGKPMDVWIQHAGNDQPEKQTLKPAEFQRGDAIVATTDPADADDPNHLAELKPDPWNPGSGLADFFQLTERLRQLTGRFIVLRVRRGDGFANLLLPPAYHREFGARMTMGQVVGLRDGSAGQRAGVRAGDVLSAVELTDARKESATFAVAGPYLAASKSSQSDVGIVEPVRFADVLRSWAQDRDGVTARVSVVRDGKVVELQAEPWEKRWAYDRARPGVLPAPLAINELGIAFNVLARVEEAPGPANGLQKGDVIKKVRFHYFNQENDKVEEDSWTELKEEDWGAEFVQMQSPLLRGVDFQVERDNQVNNPATGKPWEVAGVMQPDETWPLAERGLRLMPDSRIQKAQNLLDAVGLGLKDTYGSIREVYGHLVSMFTGRISPKNLGGPITIARVAYRFAGIDIWEFLFFMGMISVNLAVVNFLPIPVLDGGHMVFLIYEKLRGQPASEQVRIGATYLGLAMILSLMVFVFFLDIQRMF